MRPSSVLCAILILLILATVADAQTDTPAVRVGMVLDGPWERNDEILDLKRVELRDLLEGEFNVSFRDEATIICDYSRGSISAALDRLLSADDIDFVIASGPIASHLAVSRTDLPKPVIAPYVIDRVFETVPYRDGTSGVKNLNYLSPPWHVQNEIEYFREVMPFRKMAFLATGHMVDAFPYMCTVTNFLPYRDSLEVQMVVVRDDVAAALGEIDADVEAVFVTSLMHFSRAQLAQLSEGLIDRRLPSFAMMGRFHVEQGLMLGLMPDDFFIRTARRVALNIQRILLGEEAGDLPVAFAMGEQLVVNMATVRSLDKYPNWETLTEAELVHESRRQTERTVTLRQAMHEAVGANLELAAEAMAVAADREAAKQAWMALLPQVEASLTGAAIDADRAEASFGSQPEYSLSGSLSATQIVFSEPGWGNVSIQKHLHLSREARFQELRLDIVQAAATAFLDVLRTSTLERIQRDNLKVTRQNLNMARVRQSLGMARAAEVLRWESQIASNQRDVINSNTMRNIAEIQLNRLLHRPAEESFSPVEATVQNRDLISADGRLFQYMQNPRTFRILRAFMVEEAYRNSPEIRQLDEAIEAQSRLAATRSRSFFAPAIGLSASVSRRFEEDGAGTGGGDPFAGMGLTFPTTDETNWQVGLQATLPLFKGGARFSERAQANRELESLKIQRKAVSEYIAQRVRSAAHSAGATYAGIRLARTSAEAARKSRDLVTDAYLRGAVSILDLIDAQNAALVAELSAANAVYDFLIDLVEVERAAGRFVAFMTDDEWQEVLIRLNAFFDRHEGTE